MITACWQFEQGCGSGAASDEILQVNPHPRCGEQQGDDRSGEDLEEALNPEMHHPSALQSGAT